LTVRLRVKKDANAACLKGESPPSKERKRFSFFERREKRKTFSDLRAGGDVQTSVSETVRSGDELIVSVGLRKKKVLWHEVGKGNQGVHEKTKPFELKYA